MCLVSNVCGGIGHVERHIVRDPEDSSDEEVSTRGDDMPDQGVFNSSGGRVCV